MPPDALISRPRVLPGAITAVAHPIWRWLRKDWNWANLNSVKRPMLVIVVTSFVAAYYVAARVGADSTDYWRLSNYELRAATFELTGAIRRLRADSQKEAELNPEDAFAIQSEMIKDYYNNYRGPALKIAAALEQRLGDTTGSPRPIDVRYEKPNSYEDLAAVTDDLDGMALKLPARRSLGDWIEAEFPP